MSYRIRPFAVMWSWWGLCPAPSSLGLVLRRHQQHKRDFCLAFPNIAVGFSTALYRYFARHCCWHRNFQLSPSGFHCELDFFVVWFNEEYSSQLSGIVELWFLDSHLCFAFFFAASDICFHKSGHTSSGREVVCFLVSLRTGPWCIRLVAFLVNKTNLVKVVHAYDNSSSLSICSSHHPIGLSIPTIHSKWRMSGSGKVDVLHRNSKWFFPRQVQFVSGFHVMAINEISRDRPEAIFIFLIIQRCVFLKWSVGECNSFDFLWRISCSSPRSGQSQVRVDVIRRCSLPQIFDCSICDWRKWSFHFLAALTLPLHWAFWACSSDASISSNPSNVCDHTVSFLQSTRVQCLTEEIHPARL